MIAMLLVPETHSTHHTGRMEHAKLNKQAWRKAMIKINFEYEVLKTPLMENCYLMIAIFWS